MTKSEDPGKELGEVIGLLNLVCVFDLVPSKSTT